MTRVSSRQWQTVVPAVACRQWHAGSLTRDWLLVCAGHGCCGSRRSVAGCVDVVRGSSLHTQQAQAVTAGSSGCHRFQAFSHKRVSIHSVRRGVNPTANFFSHCDAATARENIERSAQAKTRTRANLRQALKNTNAHTRARQPKLSILIKVVCHMCMTELRTGTTMARRHTLCTRG